MNQSTYIFSFTAGGLLVTESIMVAEVLESCGDWDEAIRKIRDNNLLQSRTTSTATRKLREIHPRLETLTAAQLQLLVHGGRSEQLAMLWLAVCKRYAFLAEFARMVVREMYLSMRPCLADLHFDDFLETQTVWHAEIEHLTPNTRQKIRTVAMRMLREAEITTENAVIEPALLSHDVAEAIASDNREWFLIFPIAISDIPGAAK